MLGKGGRPRDLRRCGRRCTRRRSRGHQGERPRHVQVLDALEARDRLQRRWRRSSASRDDRRPPPRGAGGRGFGRGPFVRSSPGVPFDYDADGPRERLTRVPAVAAESSREEPSMIRRSAPSVLEGMMAFRWRRRAGPARSRGPAPVAPRATSCRSSAPGRRHARQVAFPKGSSTVLLFFLSSCPTCHKMIPEWNRAYQRRPKDVEGRGRDPRPGARPRFLRGLPGGLPGGALAGPRVPADAEGRRAPPTLRVGAGGKVEDHGVGDPRSHPLGQFFRP